MITLKDTDRRKRFGGGDGITRGDRDNMNTRGNMNMLICKEKPSNGKSQIAKSFPFARSSYLKLMDCQRAHNLHFLMSIVNHPVSATM